MRPPTLSALVLTIALLASACDSADPPTSIDWQATLAGQPGFESVSGSATATTEAGQTGSAVSITGATPGAAHPWHIHQGTCATDGPIVGDITAYPDLMVSPDGTAAATATIDVALSTNVAYFVNVHLSSGDLATIVACGNLTTASGNPSDPPPGNGDY